MNKKILVNKNTIVGCLFILFFCNNVFVAILSRIIGSIYSNMIYCIVFFGLLFWYCVYNRFKNLIGPLICYSTIAIIVLITYINHPEYEPWFNHSFYGLFQMLVLPRGAIWAFLIVWLIKDYKKMYNYLKITIWILFVFYIIQYATSMARGYWMNYDVDGTILKSAYSLEFGYNVLFPTSFFGAEAFLKNKKIFYIPFLTGMMMILLGGSRGSLVWPILMFPMMIPFKWMKMPQKKKILAIIASIILVPIVFIIYTYFDLIILQFASMMKGIGISSRTIETLVKGTFSDANGREQIYEMAKKLISTGGLFGRGIYGDRLYIGKYFRWGYSHNIALELYVSFGYVGGTVACTSIVYGIISLYRNSVENRQQIIFLTFLITSMKLFLSNSFWYVAAFWALLALMLMWKKSVKRI